MGPPPHHGHRSTRADSAGVSEVHPGVSPKNSPLLGSRNVQERLPGTFSLHVREGVL